MKRLLSVRWVVAFVLSLWSQLVLAADLPALTALFESRFVSGYVSGKCGVNIMELLAAAQKEGVDTSGARIVQIVDQDGSFMGLINVELARLSGRMIRPPIPGGPSHEPGERNWYHHVILEAEGHILDFDFTNEPTVLPTAEYFERMFLDEDPKPGYGGFYIGREKKLKGYELTLTPVEEHFRAVRERGYRPAETVMRLQRFLGL